MQMASSRIWIQFAVSISYDGNYYTTGNFICILGKIKLQLMI